jgi:hypothetical protein
MNTNKKIARITEFWYMLVAIFRNPLCFSAAYHRYKGIEARSNPGNLME